MFFRPNGSTKLAKRPKNIQHDQNVPNTMCENNASGSHEVEKNTTKKKEGWPGQPPGAARGGCSWLPSSPRLLSFLS